MVDLIQRLGKIGINCLIKMSITFEAKENTQKDDEELAKLNHEKFEKLRKEILNNFSQRQLHFKQDIKDNHEIDEEEPSIQKDTCCVCSITRDEKEEVLCYPAFVLHTHLPLEFDGDITWNSVLGISICKHLSHYDCIPIRCPIDRSHKNTFIPRLDNINDLNDEHLQQILRKFKKSILDEREEDDNNDIEILLHSITALIITFEVRLRSNPGCLDNDKYSILARNLFLCVRQLYLMGNVLFNEQTKWTNFRHFICDLILSQNPKGEIKDICKRHSTDLTGKDLTLYLKRVKLSEHFLLNNETESNHYLDWDELLSNENLCNEFDFKFNGEEYVFDPYKLINLPHNFFELGKEPYNAVNQIKTTATQYYICLNNGKIISEQKKIDLFQKNNFDPTVLMALNKQFTEMSIVHDNKGKYYSVIQEPIYLDFLGNPDVQLKNGHLLYLSEEKYEALVDRLLSSDFIS
ncbi:AGC family protein kinase [Histomonas meleagridis]|uniref:AGC family protein kinase n=1 Tax=Histomonas meleagridis TaxID=135588 RepID=UPI00355A275C|nr:AGC family protein kinase [Histomonas meleagridis]